MRRGGPDLVASRTQAFRSKSQSNLRAPLADVQCVAAATLALHQFPQASEREPTQNECANQTNNRHNLPPVPPHIVISGQLLQPDRPVWKPYDIYHSCKRLSLLGLQGRGPRLQLALNDPRLEGEGFVPGRLEGDPEAARARHEKTMCVFASLRLRVFASLRWFLKGHREDAKAQRCHAGTQRRALGSPVGSGAKSSFPGGPSSSVKMGFRASAQT